MIGERVAERAAPDLASWQAGTKRLRLLGHDIAFHEAGEGEPLLLVHGFPTASWDWRQHWTALAAQRRVIAPDLLGYGESDKPWPHDYRIGEQADLVLALADRLGIKRFDLVAHDYGDTVAQELLARDLEHEPSARRVRSACLLNGGLFPECHRPLPTQRLLAGPLGPLAARLMRRGTLARGMRRIFGADTPPGDEELDGFWSLINLQHGRRVIPGLLGYLAERIRHRERWVGALERSAVPLCFINGLADPISGAHMAARFRELVPQGQVVELPGIGHYPQIEAPQATLDAVLALLARVQREG